MGYILSLTYDKAKDIYTVILIAPHASLFPAKTPSSQIKKINFQENKIRLFLESGDPALSSELSLLLFESLLFARWNDRLKRLLRYTLFVLFNQKGFELEKLRLFLTDLPTRRQVLKKYVSDYALEKDQLHFRF